MIICCCARGWCGIMWESLRLDKANHSDGKGVQYAKKPYHTIGYPCSCGGSDRFSSGTSQATN